MISSSQIPKPSFKSCDETSMKLTWDSTAFANALKDIANAQVMLEYKEAHHPWDNSKKYTLTSKEVMEVNLQEADLVDLNPGTPYAVRVIVVQTDTNTTVIGPETVFDTKPVDCTPKRKRCIIS